MLKQKKNGKFRTKCGIGILSLVCFSVLSAEQAITSINTPLSFEKAIKSAQKMTHGLQEMFINSEQLNR